MNKTFNLNDKNINFGRVSIMFIRPSSSFTPQNNYESMSSVDRGMRSEMTLIGVD